MLNEILDKFKIDGSTCTKTPIGNGLINQTWHVNCNNSHYILQRVNTAVFKNPHHIDENLAQLKTYLNKVYPQYLFVAPLPATNGSTMVETQEGCYRLFNFIKDSVTINQVATPQEAFEAAKQFGRFASLLADFDATNLHTTIPDFHNLALRYTQFEQALENATPKRLANASEAIKSIKSHQDILNCYHNISNGKINIPLRVMHHDTKISNVLFDKQGKGICVIDLDTIMPGYYLSDVGDMMRSYLSPASEEETDFNKVTVRNEFFLAIYEGYMSEMANSLSPTEKGLFIYAGKFIIYMQAVRFLTDYLNNDIYYGQKYEGHNLNRANNQLRLLQEYIGASKQLENLLTEKKIPIA